MKVFKSPSKLAKTSMSENSFSSSAAAAAAAAAAASYWHTY